MPLPIQKRKNSFGLRLAKNLYPTEPLEECLKSHYALIRKSDLKGKKYADVVFKTRDLKKVLEFSNYVLSRCR